MPPRQPSKLIGNGAHLSRKALYVHPTVERNMVILGARPLNNAQIELVISVDSHGQEHTHRGQVSECVKGPLVDVLNVTDEDKQAILERAQGKQFHFSASGSKVIKKLNDGEQPFYPPQVRDAIDQVPQPAAMVDQDENAPPPVELPNEEDNADQQPDIDDDQVALPENIPAPDAPQIGDMNVEKQNGVWTYGKVEPDNDGPHADPRLAAGLYSNFEPRLRTTPAPQTAIQFLMAMLPLKYIKEVVVPQTNESLPFEFTFGMFLTWLGMYMLMARFQLPLESYFKVGESDGMTDASPLRFPPGCLSGNKFKAIWQNLTFHTPDDYDRGRQRNDKFYKFRSFQTAWNDHMFHEFIPGWWVCLDESMTKWLDDNAPGWRKCPRKPIPMGFESHTIADCATRVIFCSILVEGKSSFVQESDKAYNEYGKTGGLIMRMTHPWANAGRFWILDSGFCIIAALLGMKQEANFGIMCAKKRGKYWPLGVHGDAIKKMLDEKEQNGYRVQSTVTGPVRPGSDVKGTVKVNAFQGIEHQSIFITTASNSGESDRPLTRWNQMIDRNHFYPNYCNDYYKGRPAVDLNNLLRNGTNKSFEEAINIKDPFRKMCMYLLALSEANAVLLYNDELQRQGKKRLTLDEFRAVCGEELIHNDYYVEGKQAARRGQKRMRTSQEHNIKTKPQNAGAWDVIQKRWTPTKAKYSQSICTGDRCRRQVRTYCSCDRRAVCLDCYNTHRNRSE